VRSGVDPWSSSAVVSRGSIMMDSPLTTAENDGWMESPLVTAGNDGLV
jgi:hypothetical protein